MKREKQEKPNQKIVYTYESKGKKIKQEYFYKDLSNKYPEDYNSKRILSYASQLGYIFKYAKLGAILEIGIGNRFIYNCMKSKGLNVKTADIAMDLQPDVVCSITELSRHFKADEFGMVLAFELLEHLPLECLEPSLEEMHKVSSKYVIISVPRSPLTYGNFEFKIPFVRKLKVNFFIPLFFWKGKINNHYWELGQREMSLRQFRKMIRKYFKIIEESCIRNHKFFVLEKIG